MKQLEKKFTGKGEVKNYNFTQLKASSSAYLYEVKCLQTENKHYEVFKHVENERFGCVSYPRSKSFGIWAYTKSNLKDAEKLFNEMNVLLN